MKKAIQPHLSLTVIAGFLVLTIACSGIGHMTFTVRGGQIPPEFNRYPDTLLVILHPGDWGYDKYLRKNFKENYGGPYKLIKADELGRYPPEQYRYVFDHRSNYSTKTTTTYTPVTAGGHIQNGGSTSSTHSFTYASSDVFFVTDRSSGTPYTTGASAFYSKLMRAYLQALDFERTRQN